MRRLPFLLAVSSVAGIGGSAFAQCVDLGTPALTGCGVGPYAPSLGCSDTPTIGNSTFYIVGGIGAVGGPGILVLGPCPPPMPISGPFGTFGFCSPAPQGCTSYVDPAASALLVAMPGSASNFYPLPIPNLPSLVGATVCAQQVYPAVLAAGICIEVSNGISVTLLP